MIGIGCNRNPLEGATDADALIEPRPVQAVSGAKHVTTLDPIVRLNNLGSVSRQRFPDRAREARVPPQTADVERIANDGLEAAGARRRPIARINADADVALEQCVDCPLEKALSPTESRITLSNDTEPHFAAPSSLAASSSRAAPTTRDTGSFTRQSEILLPPQPLLPQGRQRNSADVTTRFGTTVGPHSASPLGPKAATTGVPTAVAICIGAESTPMRRRAQPINAANSGSESWATRSTTGALVEARMASIRTRSAGSRDPVTTTRQLSWAS